MLLRVVLGELLQNVFKERLVNFLRLNGQKQLNQNSAENLEGFCSAKTYRNGTRFTYQ